MKPEELKEILDLHVKYIRGEDGGKRADLEGANLEGANLERADLEGANLEGANLERADLEGANLRGANLEGANLERANLERANLRGANLERADLEGANLEGAYLPHYLIVPQEGEFLGYKFARRISGKGALLTLRILGTSQRVSSLVGRKCRASEVIAIKAEDQEGNEITGEDFTSTHDDKFVWKLNEVTKPESFSADIRLECAPGLHFYITKDEAREFGRWPVDRKYKEPQQ